MYTPKHFKVHEIVDRQLYEAFKDHPYLLLRMFDESILRAADDLRERFGPVTINNWKWDGDFEWSGLRTVHSPWYSPGSMHSRGKALDLKFKNYTADEVRAELKKMKTHKYIKRVEEPRDGQVMNWVHIDTKDVGKKEIYFFKP